MSLSVVSVVFCVQNNESDIMANMGHLAICHLRCGIQQSRLVVALSSSLRPLQKGILRAKGIFHRENFHSRT
jgi:hypothetical protein